MCWRHSPGRIDHADFDVAESNLAVVALKGDVPAVELGEILHLRKLALGDASLEVVAVQDVFKILDAVDVVLAFLGTEKQPDMVPLADWFGGIENLVGVGIDRRLVEGVKP